MSGPPLVAAEQPGSMLEPGLRVRVRRNRLLAGTVALVLVVLALLAYAGGNRQAGYLDPDAVDPSGSRALARVLTGQGVEVVPVRTASDAAAALRAAPAATLLVTVPQLVTDPMGAAVADVPLAHVVLVGAVPAAPGPWPATDLARGHLTVQTRAPDCAWPVAQRAGSAATGGTTFEAAGAASCYEGSVLDVPAGAAGVPATVSGSVTLLGTGDPLTNRELGLEGNAALATGTLGRDATLVWWIPSLADPLHGTGGAPSLTDLVPPWVPWAAVQLLIGVLVLAYARGRRLGPVVTEPLPVTVRAAETTEGLSRLYRRSGGRTHAAGLLAGAVAARLAAALALPRGITRAELAGVVADRTGRPAPEVLALLDHPAPPDDAALVRLADDLDALERAGTTPVTTDTFPVPADESAPQDPRAALLALRTEVAKAVVGQDAAVTGLVIALLCRGHVLLEGVPGVAKTLLVRAARRRARAGHQAGAVHARPDARRRHRLAGLRRAHRASSRSAQGPVFTNLLLADEINRTPPKTQAALLEAMEERQVTVDGQPAAAARPVPRRRDPEPDRVRGHLPAARGAARPVPAQADRAAARRATRSSRCCAGTPTGFDPRDLAAAGVRAGRRRRPTSRPARGRRAARCTVAPEVARLHRRPRAGPPAPSPVAAPRRVAARRDRAAGDRAGPGPGCPAATT